MLDHLSGGRLDVGVGRGVSPHEVGCYGVDPDERWAMFEESLDVLLKGLTGERLTHEGAHYRVPDMAMELRPVQRPHPPLWYGAGNEDGAARAARFGMHLVTLGANDRVRDIVEKFGGMWEEAASDPRRTGSPVRTPLVGVGRQIFVAETDGEAERLARAAYGHWYDSLAKLWRDHGGAPVTGMIFDNYDEAWRMGTVVAGSPATVRAELSAQAEHIGFSYLVCQFTWGCLTHDQEMRSLELFTSEIMPALAER